MTVYEANYYFRGSVKSQGGGGVITGDTQKRLAGGRGWWVDSGWEALPIPSRLAWSSSRGHASRLPTDCDGWDQETHQPIQFFCTAKTPHHHCPAAMASLWLQTEENNGTSAQVLSKAVNAQRLVLSRRDIRFLYLQDAQPRTRSALSSSPLQGGTQVPGTRALRCGCD